MAACDNIYGNKKQWKQFRRFLQDNEPDWIPLYLQPMPEEGQTTRICYVAEIQDWLANNCPYDWVQEQLEVNFEVQEYILGKAHHRKPNE